MNDFITYHPSDQRNLTTDDKTGSQFWSVTGKNLQFTWFDVPAYKEFPYHRHESEQITYVLEGELLFESGSEIFKLSKGDCIVIPAYSNHRVWTEDKPAKAVDAWSPINENYLIKKV